MHRFYNQFIKTGDLCFDLGANHGSRTDVFLSLGAKVIAVEPQPECTEELKEKYEGKNAEVIEAAVSSKHGEGKLYLCNMDEVSTLSEDFKDYYSKYDYLSWKKSINVKLITLDELIAKYGVPEFCKIDVEGWESEVMKGLSSPLHYLSYEFNGPFKVNVIDCIDRLSTLGEVVYNYSFYESFELESAEWLSAEEMKAKIASLPANILHGDIYAEFIRE